MPCLFIKGPNTLRVITSDSNGGFRYSLHPGEVAVVRPCSFSPMEAQDLESIWTSDGLMIGNIIKKLTSAIGIKQCMQCKGRQIAWNRKGLEIQKKWLA